MALTSWGQLLLLMWKNARLQSRKKFLTTLQIIVPTLGALIIFIMRGFSFIIRHDSGLTWPSFGVDGLIQNYSLPLKLAYAPNVTVIDRIISIVERDLGIQGVAYADPAALEASFADPISDRTVWGGLVFTNDFVNPNAFPKDIRYTLRPRSDVYISSYNSSFPLYWNTENIFPEYQTPGPRGKFDHLGGYPGYVREEFLAFMHAVDKALAMELADPGETPDRVSVQLQRFPYPPYTMDYFSEEIKSQLPLLIILGFLFTVPDLSSSIKLEKEKRLKEYMKIMGLSNWLHCTAWFLKALIILSISVIFITVLLLVPTAKRPVLSAADGSVVFVFLLLYTVSCICYSFMFTAFFKKASSSAGAAGLLFFLSYIPVMTTDIGKLNIFLTLLSCLLNNIAMAMGFRQFADFEASGAGQRWSNLHLPVSEDESLTMGHVFLMLIIDSVLYLLIMWYVENVFPGEYGVPLPFYFPCTREYWRGPPKTLHNEEEGPDVANLDPEFFEPPPANVPAGISIKNLRKEFKRGKQTKVAVAGTTIDMFEGQVTALLGHNGAGKTTTMSMLTGFMPPTSGTAVLNGFDICTQMKHVRSSLGLCPQHDVLFDMLTVHEHLTFYARLKGCPGKQVENEVIEMIRLLGLEDKANELSRGLSGGMKRRLSMGIALIYGSKIVVLDEPTSGMDPEARRKAWDILQSQREGRTVLLSTHFMDEADLLGDRIAIMAEGVVKCCGSSLFLKNKYGVGYHLVMVKEASCDVDAVTNFILQYVPDARLENNVSAELSYTLPRESSDRFEEMFTRFEKDSASLGIQSFGASVTTMEEVFMKVGESCHTKVAGTSAVHGVESDGKVDAGFTNMAYTAENGDTAQSGPRDGKAPVKKHQGTSLLLQQFKGMFIKGMIMTWRNRVITAVQIMVPVVFTLLGLIPTGGETWEESPPSVPRVLSVGNSEDQIVVYALNTSMGNNSVRAVWNALNHVLQRGSKLQDVTSEGLVQHLLKLGETDMDAYSRNYLVAVELTDTSSLSDGNETVLATGFFNAQAYHAIGMALAALDEAILKYVSKNAYSLQITNHPLPRTTVSQWEEDVQESTTSGFSLAILLIFGMSFLVSTFVVFIVTEELTKAKHVQFVSGVQTGTYWLSLYAWHLVNYLIPTIFIMIVLICSGVDEFKGSAGGYTFLLLMLYGMAILPCTYLMSFMFKKPTTAYTWTTIINVFLGIGSLMVVLMLDTPELAATRETLRLIFYILIPNFSLGIGIQDLYTNFNHKKDCTRNDLNMSWDDYCTHAKFANGTSDPCCPDINIAAWDYPGIGRSFLFLFLQIFFFFALVFFFESGIFKSIGQRILEGTNTPRGQDVPVNPRLSLSMDSHPLMGEDVDVADERKNILNTPMDRLGKQNTLILKELRKFYGGFLAVDRLSLGIPPGECFGLLGVNGAGKTTTFKMLTGDVPISSGDALLDGHSVKRDIKEVQRRLGYCPQFDALLDQMTVEETLYMYARLRGIRDGDIPGEVTQVISSLLLQDHTKKRCSELSGGNKRKLSTAMAILGDPPVVFLDEPTTGMDPIARRSLWDTLTTIREKGRTLVLTSHSMEECEALCTRLAIMVNGQFKCLGSVQHLKANCGDGYTLLAKVGGVYEVEIENNTQRLSAFVQEQFPGSELKDVHQGYIHYQVKSAGVSWARIFGTLERVKGQFCIQDYSVSQTTLEHVFINFARAQVPPRDKGLTTSQKIRNCFCFCCECGCCKEPQANQ